MSRSFKAADLAWWNGFSEASQSIDVVLVDEDRAVEQGQMEHEPPQALYRCVSNASRHLARTRCVDVEYLYLLRGNRRIMCRF